VPKYTADPLSNVFSKSKNPLDLPKKSTILRFLRPKLSIQKAIHPSPSG